MDIVGNNYENRDIVIANLLKIITSPETKDVLKRPDLVKLKVILGEYAREKINEFDNSNTIKR